MDIEQAFAFCLKVKLFAFQPSVPQYGKITPE
jgi:hypothetical protein